MSWTAIFCIVLAGIALWFIPGLAVGAGFRLKGLSLIALAAPISFSVFSCAAIIAPFLGLPWGLPLITFTTLVLTIVSASVRMLLRGRWVDPARHSGGFLLPLGIAVITLCLVAFNMAKIFGTADGISQGYDAIFHYNSIRYILNTDNASAFHVGTMSGESFYPNGWSAAVSLLAGFWPDSIPAVVNASNVVIPGLVFPLGAIFMARQIFGARKPAVLCIAGISAVGNGFFPYVLTTAGPILPYLMSICLLPPLLGLLAVFCGKARQPEMSKVTAVVAFCLALPGAVLAHPSILLSCALLSAPLWLRFYCQKIKAALDAKNRRASTTLWCAALTVTLSFTGILWVVLRPSLEIAPWTAIESVPQALGELLLYCPRSSPIGGATTLLFIIGFVALIRRRSEFLWLLGSWTVSALLYIASLAFPTGDLRTFLVGAYYNDTYRLASLPVVPAIAIMAYGGQITWQFLCTVFQNGCISFGSYATVQLPFLKNNRNAFTPPRSFFPAIGSILALLLFIITTQIGSIRWGGTSSVPWGIAYARTGYTLTADSPSLSPEELKLLKRLNTRVPAGDSLVNNPWNGSALAYAIANRKVLLPHLHSPENFPGPDEQLVLNKLKDYQTNPEVCPAVERIKSYYFLDFGSQQINNNRHDNTPLGVKNIADNPAFALIDSEGLSARLYKFIGCGEIN